MGLRILPVALDQPYLGLKLDSSVDYDTTGSEPVELPDKKCDSFGLAGLVETTSSTEPEGLTAGGSLMVMSTTVWATFLTHYVGSASEGGYLKPATKAYMERVWTEEFGLVNVEKYGMGLWALPAPTTDFTVVRGSAGAMGALPVFAQTASGKWIWVFVNQFGASASGALLPERACDGETHLLEHVVNFLSDKTDADALNLCSLCSARPADGYIEQDAADREKLRRLDDNKNTTSMSAVRQK